VRGEPDPGDAAGERGSVMILFALVLVATVTMVAIVIDLGALRYDRRADRSAADAGATAGAVVLTGAVDGPTKACANAWSYTIRNLGGDPATPSPCAPSSNIGAVMKFGVPSTR